MNLYKNIYFWIINKLFKVIFFLLFSSAFAQFDMGDAPASYHKTTVGILLAPRNIASPDLRLGTISTVNLLSNWVLEGKNNNLPFGYSSSPSNYGYRESKVNLDTKTYTTFYSDRSIIDFTIDTIPKATLGYENDIYRLFGYKKPTIEAGTYTVYLIVRLLANYATGIRVVLDSFIDVFDIFDTSVE